MCQSADHRSILETFTNPSQPIKAWNFGIVAGFRKLEEKTAGSFPGLLHRQLLLHVCPKSKEKGSFDKAWQSVINMLLRSGELIADSPCPLNGFVPLPTHLSYSFLFVPFCSFPARS